ncbi:LysR family transcriptional regulator [Xanthomonas sp. AmX2]|uniref:LysR family transcriptional regulator n=1 Tax=Xanthomonas sp. TaxID=29446 RepID=UPI00197E781E|nr:LysR family transcriptional regulator [Xanthomonas sp.]MBN6150505.1 LysR family transcriptional regulator [Xanthomonas sp.]
MRSVDMNLLVVLDALLDEAHVSRAAQRLGLSQPAASNALERCRALFGDRLLERARGGMRLTPRAEALRGPLRELLDGARRLLSPAQSADLRTLRQPVHIAMADPPAGLLGPPLLQRLQASAPGIDLVLHPWRSADAAWHALAAGEIDLALSVLPQADVDFQRVPLFDERYRVLMRRGHPAARGFDLERWLAYPHLLVSARGASRGPLDEALQRIGRARRVGMVVPSFTMAVSMLERSDLIALLPSLCLPPQRDRRFVAFDPPLPMEGFPLHLAWHRRRHGDVGVQHVAALLQGLVAALRQRRAAPRLTRASAQPAP